MSQKSKRRSRREFIVRGGQLATTALLAGCAASRTPTEVGSLVDQLVLPESPFGSEAEAKPLRPELPGDINPTLGGTSKSLDVQIGQMILAGFNGQQLTPNSAIVKDVAQARIGSVALFGRNVVSADQLTTLTATLQQTAEIPLLISVDQEGGQVRRLGRNFGLPANYSAAQLGRLNDLNTSHSYAGTMAKVLRQVGINLNLAPVVDLNVNPANPVIGSQGRSFSHDPAVVTAQALAFIQAHHQEGVLCTLKHFPGHGSSAADSHLGFVDVTETWSEDELAPFAAIIKAGKCDVVMTAHIFNAKLDNEHPATLSQAVVTGILRQRFGYDGVIMTDDIQMGAIRNYYEFDRAIELALDAGVDIFAISRYTPVLVDRVFSTIHKLVKAGRISEERIYASFRRIMELKKRMHVQAPTILAAADGAADDGATATADSSSPGSAPASGAAQASTALDAGPEPAAPPSIDPALDSDLYPAPALQPVTEGVPQAQNAQYLEELDKLRE